MNSPIPGTVVIYGPFFARTGFGVLARGWAMALHNAGVKIRIVPVDCNDPNASGDLDDCDLYLLQSLKYTPLTTPVTAIFAYVPTYVWPKVQLPEPCRRILLTTFDSSANAATPPPRLTFIGNQMDQVWVATRTEEQAWVRGGLNPDKVHSFNWPHEWIENAQLGAPVLRTRKPDEPFRFLHISLFLPRRRLDALIRAFFEEFQRENQAELYLKMGYPTWHPVPGKPRMDLLALIERLQKETGSTAKVVVDELLGTRLELARLIDRCDAYVSPDTTHTAPVTEAIVRNRPVIITDGWGVDLPPQALVVPNSTGRVAITPEMADYMPHQRGTSFPALDVGLMRQALRRTFDLPAEEHRELVNAASQYMRERYSYAATAPAAIAAIRKGWEDKHEPVVEVVDNSSARIESNASKTRSPLNINWCGLQLFYGKIPTANREICLELLRRGHRLSLLPGNGPFHIEELDLNTSQKYQQLARKFYEPLKAGADLNVSNRWHPVFNEQPATRQIIASTWWYGAIPNDWIEPIGQYAGEVWVPSRFVLDNFQRSGILADQLQVIPLGVDPNLFRPGIAPYALETKKRYKFLFVGETTQRKGLDLVLNAYLKTFTSKDDVCLVIKDMNCEDYYGRLAARETVRKCQAGPRAPEIQYIPMMLSEANLAALYVACDCFVQPHRASSSGAAVMEAMACGLPVITTEYGGVLDFCSKETAHLLPAREVRKRNGSVGHWKVSGEQIHAEPNQRALEERMEQVFKNSSEAKLRAVAASEHVRTNFSWAKTVDRIEQRFEALQSTPEKNRPRPTTLKPASTAADTKDNGPTVVIFAPFYNRSGYGVAARSLAVSLHGAGMKIKSVPVDNVEEGIDDCDMEWLKSLEKTPVTLPVVAIFFHVPMPAWLQVKLPPESVRIMFTTFDSSAQGNLPPADWVSVCKQMDQLWLMTEKEASVFATAGVPRSNIHVVKSPHPWINNPALPLPQTAPKADGKRFRFLCVSMFLPRRRWDTLIEAFLMEFKDTPDAELCLKVNYPSWHPVPGQPQRDLRQLIETLRARTGSKAQVILDESLDTRLGICRLMDRCDAYISTDTSITAPVGEAFVRGKIAVIPDGYGVALPYCEAAFVIPVDPKLTQPMTEEMLAYQPHHRGKQMPLLGVEDVRRTLRAAYETPEAERIQKGHFARLMMECTYGLPVVTPAFVKAINAGLREKFSPTRPNAPQPIAKGVSVSLDWVGSFLDHGSLSHVNRELTQALKSLPGVDLKRVTNGAAVAADAPTVWPALANELTSSTPADAAITVRHAWPPNWQRPAQGKLVVIQPWEFGSLPQEWVEQSKNVDEFWVPSGYVRKVYTDSGIQPGKVQVVPNGIDPERFRPGATPRKLSSTKSFKFLFVGGTIPRKGIDVLLQAFLKTFTTSDDVALVIKDFGGNTTYKGQTWGGRIAEIQRRPNAPEIIYLDREFAPEELPGLYTSCDCLVHPYRGEGFGLPVLEAMACGLPVIVTAGGATDDFATDEFAYHIPATRHGIGHEISGMKLAAEGWLLEPDVNALSEKLKWITTNLQAARAKGRAASEHARRNWTWQRASEIALARLEQLATPPGAAPQPRSTTVELPPVARIGNLKAARELLSHKKLCEAWETALAAINARPFHPEAFMLLAEISLAAGDATSARQCAARARDLAPGWDKPKQFLKKPLKGNAKSDWLKLPMGLNSQLSTPKRSAGPLQLDALNSRLTLCLIAKNEEKFLGRCLKSIHGLAQQIIVVDTGSTDRTVEIAKAHGAEVHSFAWCDDFSAARNAALEHATGDWILMLDADEELPADQHARLRADLMTEKVIAHRLPLANVGQNDGQSFVPRLFRNAPGVYFHGRIHEQVFSSLVALGKTWGLGTALGTAQILHHGYTKEVVQDRNKIQRNLRLLRQAIQENPADANLAMNFGLELVRSGDLTGGLGKYREAIRLMSAQKPGEVVPELREVLLTQFTSHLYKISEHEEVVCLLNSPLAKNGGLSASLYFALGLSNFELKNYREAAEQMRQCLARRNQTALSPINTDIHTCAPNHCLALSLAKLGDHAGAEKAFQIAHLETGRVEDVKLDFARFLATQNRQLDALHKLNEIVAQNSRHAAAWRLGGEIALSRPDFLEFARDWTGEATRHLAEDIAITAQRAEVLLLSGDTASAYELWERIYNTVSQPMETVHGISTPSTRPNEARGAEVENNHSALPTPLLLLGGEGARLRVLAALILCEAIESQTTHAPDQGAQETQTSREFIAWYQKLLATKAQTLIECLNGQTEKLSRALPTAAGIIEKALFEAEQGELAAAAS